MGAFLDKPKTEKHTEVQHSASVRAGLTSMQGWRIEQEDAHSLILELPDNPQAGWFAVFDGHGGSLVSEKSAERLHKLISVDSLEPETLKPKVRNAFLQLDKELHEDPKVQRGEDHSGTTAVTCLLTPQHMICANCGDSRAILVRNEEAKALSYDHKPFNDKERERIYKAGGTVTMGRVNGDLAVSRALGDYVYKFVSDLPAEQQQVSPEPEFVVIPRDPEQDQFMVLACDGIWDVMSNDEVAKWVLDQTKAGCDNVGELAETLVDECLSRGSKDNMSVVIVAFEAAPRPSQEKIEEYKKLKEEEAKRQAQEEAGENNFGNESNPSNTGQQPGGLGFQ